MNTPARTIIVAAIGATSLLLGCTSPPAPEPLTPQVVAAVRKPAAVKPPRATTIIRCEKARSGRDPFYKGPSASVAYDKRFSEGPRLSPPKLSTHTPQGVAWWQDWDGRGNDLLLISAHAHKGDTARSQIIGLDANGRTVGVVDIARVEGDRKDTHAGALGLDDTWLYVDGPKAAGGLHTIRRYSLKSLATTMSTGGAISPDGATERVYGASFLTVDGRHLYAGKFNKRGHRDWMYSYTIANGKDWLKPDYKGGKRLRWEIPGYTQGVAKAEGRFLFSSSSGRKNRSNLYVTDASQTNLDRASPRCFRAPTMAQGITVAPGGKVYLSFESGSDEFDGRDGKGKPKNIIWGVHTAGLSSLTGLRGGTLRLGTLHAKEQEDVFGDDEIAIRVESQQLGKTIKMDEGERRKIGKTIQFTGNAKVSLHERDEPDADDFLGTHTFTPGAKKGIRSFTRDAHYRLSYTVR